MVEAIEYYKETKTIFNKASMNMCKWSSNNETVMKNIPPYDRCDDYNLKVLGILWNRSLDTISLCKVNQ